MLPLLALPLLIFFAVWGIAEYRRWPTTHRCAVMVAAATFWLLTGFLITALERHEYNSYFRCATHTLLYSSCIQLEAGRNALVLSAWKELGQAFEPGYETRGNYEELVLAAVKRMEGR